MNKAGIYLSIPFCRQKCTYCNFASDVHPASLLPRYLDCLAEEITVRIALWEKAGIPASDVPVDSIYMGGGTPGLLSGEQLGHLLEAVRASFAVEGQHSSAPPRHPKRRGVFGGPRLRSRLGSATEITIEASPENVTPESAAAWAECGINRVSLGVQSMVREELRAVARMHDAETVAQAFSSLRAAGIENISADLIAGLPNQTAGSWQASLRGLLGLNPAHLSIYMLEVDEDSRLGRAILEDGARYHAAEVPSEEEITKFYCTAMETLRNAGFEHYEISNFSLPGRRSRHNEKYWLDAPYYGFGVDAHSYDGHRRWATTDSLIRYLEMVERREPPVVELRALGSQEKLEERFFLGLRRREGVSIARLSAEFAAKEGVTAPSQRELWEKYAKPIREFREAEWLETEGDRLRLTDRGLLVSNEVFAGFLEGN